MIDADEGAARLLIGQRTHKCGYGGFFLDDFLVMHGGANFSWVVDFCWMMIICCC